MVQDTKETKDHVHQRSCWFTHGEVNGIDFWTEMPTGRNGTIVHRKFVKIASGRQAEIVTENDWLGPSGKKVCEDRRHLAFGALGDARWINFDITLRASQGPVTFGDTKEGSFGLRVAQWLAVDSKQGGQIVNSHGETDAAAWGKRAQWVDYHGTLDGQGVGIAMFNHPDSFRYPTGWHVRTYGLFAANPFARKGFNGKRGAGGSRTLCPRARSLFCGTACSCTAATRRKVMSPRPSPPMRRAAKVALPASGLRWRIEPQVFALVYDRADLFQTAATAVVP